jgi:hypothetical protein
MTARTRGHMTLIESPDQVAALAPISSVSQLVAAVITAATQWASEADALAALMDWSPGDSSLGQATLRLLDAVHTLEAQAAWPAGGEPAG